MAPNKSTRITDFPDELLEHIVNAVVHPHDISALTFCCRRFWLLAEPDAWRSVVIRNRDDNASFKAAIKRKPQRAVVVRSLVVDRFEEFNGQTEDTDDELGDCSDAGPVRDNHNSEVSILPKLVNLVTYRRTAAEPGGSFRNVLSRAARGSCFTNLKTCSLQILPWAGDEFYNRTGHMQPFGDVFSIPSIEDLTIRGCWADDFNVFDSPDSGSNKGSTSLRRLRWLQGDLRSDALHQLLQYPRRLEELTIQFNSCYCTPSHWYEGNEGNWNKFVQAIVRSQPRLRSLCLDSDYELKKAAPLQIQKLPCLESLLCEDWTMFSINPAIPPPSPELPIPLSLQTLGIVGGNDKFNEPLYGLLRASADEKSQLRNLRYMYLHEVPSQLEELCKEIGVSLELIDGKKIELKADDSYVMPMIDPNYFCRQPKHNALTN